jgi:hypothetical protein
VVFADARLAYRSNLRAAAHAELASAYCLSTDAGLHDFAAVDLLAQAAIRRALELEPQLGFAYAAGGLGFLVRDRYLEAIQPTY